MTIKDKLLMGMIIVMLSCMVATLLLGAYWLFWPVNVLDINKIDMLTPQVIPGKRLEYVLHYTKHFPLHADISKQLIGIEGNPNAFAVIDRAGGNLPCGHNIKATSGTIIPLSTTPGKYIMRVTVRYQINPLRYYVENYDTPPFEVIKGRPER